ncbi:voltage-gated potassium channel subunit beta-1 isoform X1 [Solea senegalensis]|uniref:Voltage-gated potassium channel subunit beta-1 isoform X1 n=1 Tax=Solea senegalensis TaxID=28829 RepID=A0AAV6PYY6_SOLSE|nr:voltage-gated potassium channel subunit beta-1 isoform X1 [Solea senegalensis]
MYLYKATCPDIPNPKQKGSRSHGGVQAQGLSHGRLVRQTSTGTGPRPYAPLMLWTAKKPKGVVRLKQLEEFLNVHSLSLHDTVKSQTGMVYSFINSGISDVCGNV